jgi:Tol biopolymer transport system component
VPIAADPAEDVWPDLSPNGRYVTFASLRTGNREILVADLQNGSIVNVSQHAGDDNWPRFSPNGHEIAFHTNRDGNYEIYVANADGTGTPRRVTNNTELDQWPDWSPTGKHIAFRRGVDIWVIDAEGEEQGPRQLTFLPATLDQMPVWSPNGQQIAFMSFREGYCSVFLMSAEGDAPANPAVNLTPRDPADPNAAWCSRAPAWSRNGRQIYFMSFRPSTGGAGAAFNEIFVMNADGSEQTRLTFTPGEDGGPQMR